MSDDDPFEELEDEDREGDPFDRLGDPATEEDQSSAESDDGEFFPDAPEEKTDVSDSTTRSDDEARTDRRDPLDPHALAGGPDTGAERSESGPAFDLDDDGIEKPAFDPADDGIEKPAFDPADDGIEEPAFDSGVSREGDPFEQVDDAFTEMDVDDVDPNDVWQELAGSESRDAISETGGRTYAEVSKHSYCEQCEFFSNPPDVSCAHDGTEIVEFLDMETVRVVDCPIVAERKEIREGSTGPE